MIPERVLLRQNFPRRDDVRGYVLDCMVGSLAGWTQCVLEFAFKAGLLKLL